MSIIIYTCIMITFKAHETFKIIISGNTGLDTRSHTMVENPLLHPGRVTDWIVALEKNVHRKKRTLPTFSKTG